MFPPLLLEVVQVASLLQPGLHLCLSGSLVSTSFFHGFSGFRVFELVLVPLQDFWK